MPRALQRAKIFLNNSGHGFGDIAIPIVMSGADDVHVLNELRTAWLAHHGPNPRIDSDFRAERAHSRLRTILNYLSIEDPTVANYKYLDVGCSEGDITGAMANQLGLAKDHAFGLDIVAPSDSKSERFTFIKIDGVHLPFEDASFELVSMFMSAHHFANPSALFAEVARVAKPGARLIMREHSMADKETSMYYDFVHAYYSAIQSEETTPEKFAEAYSSGKYAEYRAPAAWVQLLSTVGFSCVNMTTPRRDSFDSFQMLFIRGGAEVALAYEQKFALSAPQRASGQTPRGRRAPGGGPSARESRSSRGSPAVNYSQRSSRDAGPAPHSSPRDPRAAVRIARDPRRVGYYRQPNTPSP